MDMELFILVNTASDFSILEWKKASLLRVVRMIAFVLITFCAVGHIPGLVPAGYAMQA